MKLDSFLYDVVGLQSPQGSGGATDNVRRAAAGILVPYVDQYWGGGELMYAKASAIIVAQEPVQFAPALNTITLPDGSTTTGWEIQAAPLATAVNPGIQLGVAMQTMAANDYGWFIRSGRTPIRSLLVGAIGPIWGSGTAARIFTTDTAQKLWSGSRLLYAGLGATVVIGSRRGIIGQTLLKLQTTRGLVLNMHAAGTGVAAASVISAINHDTAEVTLSAVHTAAVTGNITFTYSASAAGANPWLPLCEIDRPWQEHTV